MNPHLLDVPMDLLTIVSVGVQMGRLILVEWRIPTFRPVHREAKIRHLFHKLNRGNKKLIGVE